MTQALFPLRNAIFQLFLSRNLSICPPPSFTVLRNLRTAPNRAEEIVDPEVCCTNLDKLRPLNATYSSKYNSVTEIH